MDFVIVTSTMKSVQSIRSALRQHVQGAMTEEMPDGDRRRRGRVETVYRPRDEPASRDQGPISESEEQRRGPGPRDFEDLVELGEADDETVAKALKGEVGGIIRRAVGTEGIDALGWYVPFHVYGSRWGIYIPVSGILYLAGGPLAGLPVNFQQRTKIALRMVHQHELFHFATEYACAQLELATSKAVYNKRSVLMDPRLRFFVQEECVANAWMLRSFRGGKAELRPRGTLDQIRNFIEGQPPGYRDAPSIVRADRFEAACHDLLCKYNGAAVGPAGIDEINATWLYPMRPRIEWHACPIHIVHDEDELSLPRLGVDYFSQIEAIEETPSFRKQLRAMGESNHKAWRKVRRILADTTASYGLDFKLWERRGADSVYSVRVSRSVRAHLRYTRPERRWYAEAIGEHKAMGHG